MFTPLIQRTVAILDRVSFSHSRIARGDHATAGAGHGGRRGLCGSSKLPLERADDLKGSGSCGHLEVTGRDTAGLGLVTRRLLALMAGKPT